MPVVYRPVMGASGVFFRLNIIPESIINQFALEIIPAATFQAAA
jgi:hypothetical protein